jgi:hypothetical protein
MSFGITLLRSSALYAWLVLAGSAQAGDNLVVNGDAETGDLTGWTDTVATGYSILDSSEDAYEGQHAFYGGPTGPSGAWTNQIHQDVDVSGFAASIDAGKLTSFFQSFARSNSDGVAVDVASVTVQYRNQSGTVLEFFSQSAVSAFNEWIEIEDTRAVPVGTRIVRVVLGGTRSVGGSTDAFHDAIWLSVEEVTPTDDASLTELKARYR